MIIKQRQSNYELPPEGEVIATLMEIQDLGELPNSFKPGEKAHYARLIWKSNKWPDNVRVFQKVKISTHPSSTFYDVATQLLGAFPDDDFDSKILVGKSAYVLIGHSDDGRWANVKDVRPIKYKGRTMPKPENLGMEPATVSVSAPPKQANPEITDEDVPF